MLRAYVMLTKPGIIFGNIITAIAGFILASSHINYALLLAMLVGLSAIIASACVYNNYIDRVSDAKMIRTKNRTLVIGLVSVRNALTFATVLGLFGITVLAIWTNLLTVSLALLGMFVYLILYSFWKYRSSYATLIGSIAGGMPPVVGYCAVSNRFDLGALLLFTIVVLWQMPHFFAIAMYRLDEYVAAAIPVLPVEKGRYATKIQMLSYIVAFTLASLLLTVFGYTGKLYLVTVVILGITWMTLCIKGFTSDNDMPWSRKMFLYSLVVITLLSFMIVVDS